MIFNRRVHTSPEVSSEQSQSSCCLLLSAHPLRSFLHHAQL
jgi:hypothetical protein